MSSLSREDILAVLSCMKAEVPSDTNISDDALDKRLQKVLKAAQYLEKAVPQLPLDPAVLSKWGPQRGSVMQTFRRGNLDEALFSHLDAAVRGQTSVVATQADNAFTELRRLVGGIASLRDVGQRWCVVEVDGRVAMNLRVVDVYELDTQTPVVVVLYKVITLSDASARAGLEWIEAARRRESGASLHATELGLKLLARLLMMNTKCMPSSFRPKKDVHEKDFKTSFLLPVGPLDYEDVGKFEKYPPCKRCGKATKERCAECMSVPYCSIECQKADWSAHKGACRALGDGTWRTLPLLSHPPGVEHMPFSSNLNRYNSRRPQAPRCADDAVLPNTHGDVPFMVKIQSGGSHMLVYDRARSFQAFFARDADPAGFQAVLEEMRGPKGGYGGLKMYRWARRTGERELSVCLDREPQTGVTW